MQRRIRIRSRARAAISRVLHRKARSQRLRRVESLQVGKGEAQRPVAPVRAQKALVLVRVQERRRRLNRPVRRRLRRVQVARDRAVRDAAAPGGREAAGGLAEEAGDTAADAVDRGAGLEVRVDVRGQAADRVGRTSGAREIM